LAWISAGKSQAKPSQTVHPNWALVIRFIRILRRICVAVEVASKADYVPRDDDFQSQVTRRYWKKKLTVKKSHRSEDDCGAP
jgi:hypothetical protein